MLFPVSLVTGVFSSKLKFVVKDCDPTTGKPDDEAGYEDEYTVLTHYTPFHSKTILYCT